MNNTLLRRRQPNHKENRLHSTEDDNELIKRTGYNPEMTTSDHRWIHEGNKVTSADTAQKYHKQ